MGLLTGKVAIVTGGGRGIGQATCLAFAREGAQVVVNDSGVSPLGDTPEAACAAKVVEAITAEGGEAAADESAIEGPEAAAQLVRSALDRFGRIDVLVNNAGIQLDAALLKLPSEDWSRVLDTNLSGYFHLMQHVVRHMKERGGGGSVINTTGRAGLYGNLGQSSYAAAAAGVYGLTRTASVELQRYEIRVNAVAPLAKTRLTEELPLFRSVTSMRPEHIAPVHVFLASDLSRHVSGVLVGVAGGKLSTYRISESSGIFKEDEEGLWTPSEIADNWDALARQYGS